MSRGGPPVILGNPTPEVKKSPKTPAIATQSSEESDDQDEEEDGVDLKESSALTDEAAALLQAGDVHASESKLAEAIKCSPAKSRGELTEQMDFFKRLFK